MKPVELSAEAVDDSWEAAQWYEDRQTGLGLDLLDEVEALLPLLGERPRSFPRVRDTDHSLGIRRALLPRFPYGLVFIELPEQVRVLAVAHLKRHPDFWLHRIIDE